MPADRLSEIRSSILLLLPEYAGLVTDHAVPANSALREFVVRIAPPLAALATALELVRDVAASAQLVASRFEVDAGEQLGHAPMTATLIVRI